MTSMSQFRLWVLVGSILMTLLCGGFRDLNRQPASDSPHNEFNLVDSRLANELPPDPP